jgi:hypothetical protein
MCHIAQGTKGKCSHSPCRCSCLANLADVNEHLHANIKMVFNQLILQTLLSLFLTIAFFKDLKIPF